MPATAATWACRAVASGRTASVAGFLALCAAGCATTVPLHPEPPALVSTTRIDMTVGFHHDRHLLDDQRSVDAYGNGHEFILPLGTTSDTLLQSVYPRLFTRTVRLDKWPPGATPIDAAIRPEIGGFRFPLQNLKGPYWAELRYDMTLLSPAGEEIHSWTVKGWGISGDGSNYGEFGPIAAAVEQAMASAGRKLADSFGQEPELQRWQHGLAAEQATAAQSDQRTGAEADGDRQAAYPGVVSVAARISGRRTTGLAVVRIRIRNEGTSRLAVDPLTFSYAPYGQPAIEPIPGAAVAAAVSARYGRIMPPPVGTGIAALPNLFISLINAAADSAERQSLQASLAHWEKDELHERVVERGDAIEGLVFFPLPPAMPLTAELTPPLIALDTATRYIVRIPLIDTHQSGER
jgi:hypothetical protein